MSLSAVSKILRLFDISPARAFAGKIADVSKAVDKNSPIALFFILPVFLFNRITPLSDSLNPQY